MQTRVRLALHARADPSTMDDAVLQRFDSASLGSLSKHFVSRSGAPSREALESSIACSTRDVCVRRRACTAVRTAVAQRTCVVKMDESVTVICI
jgi:hypothetical protein